MPRAYWKGYLRLSLVTCPIELYPATSQAEKTHFHQINTTTGNRLRQRMIDEKTGRAVDKEHKGKGFEVSKGKYVQIEDAELDAVEVESTHTVEIEGFVPRAEIDNRYLNKPYYIAPGGKAGTEAFAVIRDAMKDKDRVALARIVITNREHIIALEPLGKGLLGTTLHYEDEVRDESKVFSKIRAPKIAKDMVSLAAHILDSKATHFDPSKFKDEYDAALKKLVQRKAKGKEIKPREPEKEADNVIDLMEALRNSLKGKKGGGGIAGQKTSEKSAAKKNGRKASRKTAKKTGKKTQRKAA
jgi:DNA end-binding protein Ku